MHFAEKPETVPADMREISPEFLLFTPRQWEMIASQIEAQMLDARPWRQRLYQWAITAPPQLRWLADALVLRAVRDNTGLGRPVSDQRRLGPVGGDLPALPRAGHSAAQPLRLDREACDDAERR